MTFEQANKNKDYDSFKLEWHICICDTCDHSAKCYVCNHDDLQCFGNSVDSCDFYKKR